MNPAHRHAPNQAAGTLEITTTTLVEELSRKALVLPPGERMQLAEALLATVQDLDRQDEIYILAIAPFAKKPGYWKSRRPGA